MQQDKDKGQVPDRLRDGRDAGEWESAYPGKVLFQIYAELVYLLALLGASIYFLCSTVFEKVAQIPYGDAAQPAGGMDPQQAYWFAVALGGTIGGAVFALKWHYHSVAKRIWHRDRLVWRITAPILSGVLATFVIMMIRSEIIPLLSVEKLKSVLGGVSFSFFLGLFSDNLLASLQNLAAQMFGTLKDKNQTDVKAVNIPLNDESSSGA